MTEWNGFKVGDLYKRTGKGSRGWPLAMITGMRMFGSPDSVIMQTLQNDLPVNVCLWKKNGQIIVPKLSAPWPYKLVN